jgi:hypothetical protein
MPCVYSYNKKTGFFVVAFTKVMIKYAVDLLIR